ncbi:MAG: glycosyltransferase [Pseudomonadota bacterium]
MHTVVTGLGLILLALAIPGLIELSLLTLFSLWRSRATGLSAATAKAVTVVIPAHNEEANLAPTLTSALASLAEARAATGLPHRIVVIADNCNDATASIARAHGVDVLERHDTSARGKGYALNFAFTALADDASAGFVVIDADTRVPSDFISQASAAFGSGMDCFQASYRVLNADDSVRTKWMQLALTGFNHLRLIARERLGFSVGILGNGFGLSKAALERVPYTASSVVEDLEYHLRLVQAGLRVRHLAGAEVRAEMPVQADAAGTQRARWEGGRFQMIRQHSLSLALAVLRGRLRLLEPLLELLLLPLAYQLMLFLLLALWPWPPTQVVGLAGLAMIALHVLSAARQSEVPGIFGVLLQLPLYVFWKLARLGGILRLSGDKDAAWERTRRLAEDAPNTRHDFDMSIVIVSFNTKHLLDECLVSVEHNRGDLRLQVIVVDNASRDGSADFLAENHPGVELIRSSVNLGFGPANNVGFAQARGKYTVLLNTDAFLDDGVLARSWQLMEADAGIGLLGALLIGRDGVRQPSARMFPSLLNDFLTLSGLAWRYPQSRFFGRFDRTWADPQDAADVDWVPGAFSVIRSDLLQRLQGFDTRFFLYYEEVDLCRRIQASGARIRYEPALRVVHIGGESSKSIKRLSLSSSGNQLTLWRMRAGLMYYRKHHGWIGAWLIRQMESRWHQLRALKPGQDPARQEESQVVCTLMQQAWQETDAGRSSPPQPW